MFELSVLGQKYVQITDLGHKILPGDLIYFPKALDRDAYCYMFVRNEWGLGLVNWVGFKAGLMHAMAFVPKNEIAPEGLELRWFKENWTEKFIGEQSFEAAVFLTYLRDGSEPHWDYEKNIPIPR